MFTSFQAFKGIRLPAKNDPDPADSSADTLLLQCSSVQFFRKVFVASFSQAFSMWDIWRFCAAFDLDTL
jgi:hypothetical protein